jgi:hypothetical protein
MKVARLLFGFLALVAGLVELILGLRAHVPWVLGDVW